MISPGFVPDIGYGLRHVKPFRQPAPTRPDSQPNLWLDKYRSWPRLRCRYSRPSSSGVMSEAWRSSGRLLCLAGRGPDLHLCSPHAFRSSLCLIPLCVFISASIGGRPVSPVVSLLSDGVPALDLGVTSPSCRADSGFLARVAAGNGAVCTQDSQVVRLVSFQWSDTALGGWRCGCCSGFRDILERWNVLVRLL